MRRIRNIKQEKGCNKFWLCYSEGSEANNKQENSMANPNEKSRDELVAEYTKLRNATYPKDKFGRNRYYDFLIDTDVLAAAKTDAQLVAAIKRLKEGA